MNTKIMKRINRHSENILIEWVKTQVPEEEQEKVSIKNIKQLLPSAKHFYAYGQIRLSFYTLKLARKCIKKLYNLGKDIESITVKDLEDFVNSTRERYN